MIHKTLHNLDGYRQTDSLSKAGPAEDAIMVLRLARHLYLIFKSQRMAINNIGPETVSQLWPRAPGTQDLGVVEGIQRHPGV